VQAEHAETGSRSAQNAVYSTSGEPCATTLSVKQCDNNSVLLKDTLDCVAPLCTNVTEYTVTAANTAATALLLAQGIVWKTVGARCCVASC
jgi:hypothetical protein